jgi:hypothetical protein
MVLHQNIRQTCSVVFRPIKAVGPLNAPMPDPKLTSPEELDEVYVHSLSLIREGEPWEKANVVASKVMFYLHLDRWAEARATLEHLLKAGFTMDSDLGICQRFLNEKEFALRESDR